MNGAASNSIGRTSVGGEEPDVRIANQFGKMKTEGCNVLVTGSVCPDVTYHATRTLLGDEKEPRDRVIACTDLVPETDHYLRSGYDVPPEVVVSRGVVRSASTADTHDPREMVCPPSGKLDSFQSRICTAIADADGRSSGLKPSQLRLSVLTLRPLVEKLDSHEIARFVRVLTTMVSGVKGMAHYHLPVEDDHELVDRHGDLFDVRLELRNREGIPAEMRWHLPAIDHTTQWYPL